MSARACKLLLDHQTGVAISGAVYPALQAQKPVLGTLTVANSRSPVGRSLKGKKAGPATIRTFGYRLYLAPYVNFRIRSTRLISS